MNWLATAQAGQPLASQDLWSGWSFTPAVVVPLEVTGMAYLWGVWNVWRRAGAGHGINWWQCLSFVGGVLALAAAVLSPLDALSSDLFSAHMVQHLLLNMVAAPLLVLSDVPLALLWALPRGRAQTLAQRLKRRRGLARAWQVVSHPVSAWLWFAIALWAWHAPTLYEAALRDGTLHAAEHLAYLATGMLFWYVLFRQGGPDHRRYGVAIPYLFTTSLHSGVLAALMTFTSQPWYAYYAARAMPAGLTALQDQQLAGLVMWLPGGAVFSLLTIVYFGAWFRALAQRSARAQPRDWRQMRQELE